MPILTDLLNQTRRRRRLRDLLRNVRWVSEARRTPPLWTEYADEPEQPDEWSREEYDPRAGD